jgi:hypothetical protein
MGIFAPDPSAHTDPEIEKRCIHCHPERQHYVGAPVLVQLSLEHMAVMPTFGSMTTGSTGSARETCTCDPRDPGWGCMVHNARSFSIDATHR